jgi:hypothetical protein
MTKPTCTCEGTQLLEATPMSKALMKYEPTRAVLSVVHIKGHTFRRALNWRCRCGMRRPTNWLMGSVTLQPCPRKVPP